MVDVAELLKKKTAAMRELQEDIHALERVQRMSPNGTQRALPIEEAVTSISLAELREERTQQDALDFIADRNGGYLKVKEVKKLMIDAGFIHGNPRYAYGHIYALLKNNERYDQLGKGAFQKKAPLPSSSLGVESLAAGLLTPARE